LCKLTIFVEIYSTMISIYHNPKCSKSREGLSVLENSGKDFKKILYLEEKLTKKELAAILKKLNIPPIDLVRKKKSIWKENYNDRNFSDQEIIKIMVENPKLIERPIVVNNDSAVVGRPTSKITEII